MLSLGSNKTAVNYFKRIQKSELGGGVMNIKQVNDRESSFQPIGHIICSFFILWTWISPLIRYEMIEQEDRIVRKEIEKELILDWMEPIISFFLQFVIFRILSQAIMKKYTRQHSSNHFPWYWNRLVQSIIQFHASKYNVNWAGTSTFSTNTDKLLFILL